MSQTTSVPSNSPVDGVMYKVVLGDTFDQHEDTKDSYHTAQYNFKPAGIDQTRPGIFRKYENGTLEVEYANKTNKTDRVIFRGNYSVSKDVECLLIFDNGTLRLERIAGSGRSLKAVREIPNSNNNNSVNSNSNNNNNNVNSTTPSPTSSFSTTPSPTSTPPTTNELIEPQESLSQPSPIKKGKKVTATKVTTSASRGKRKSTGQTRLPPIFNPSSPKKSKTEKIDTQNTSTEVSTSKKLQLPPPQPKANSNNNNNSNSNINNNNTNTTTTNVSTLVPLSTYVTSQRPSVEIITPEEKSPNSDYLTHVVVSEELVFSDDEDLIRDIENSTTQRVVENIQPMQQIILPANTNNNNNNNLDNNIQKALAPNTQAISNNVPMVNTDNISKKSESSDESDDSDDESDDGDESSSSGSSSSGSGSSSSGSEDESEE